MTWSPITEVEIWDVINHQEAELSPRQSRLWETIRIMPAKWQQDPRGNAGGGFWAVALIGQHVIWYNYIEDDFDISRYTRYGTIEDYGASQFTLSMCMPRFLNLLESGIAPCPPQTKPKDPNPLYETELWNEIVRTEAALTPALSRVWDAVHIRAERWRLPRWGGFYRRLLGCRLVRPACDLAQ